MDSREELQRKHKELLREVDAAMEESRTLRARLGVLQYRVKMMERQVKNILILHMPAPVPAPVAAAPVAAPEQPLSPDCPIPDPQGV